MLRFKSYMNASQFIKGLASRGRYHFTIEEAQKALQTSLIATRAALRRLTARGDLASPYRGFHIIVPPEYRSFGSLPAEQFIPQLMAHLKAPYYVGCLSAAQLHGAAHQRPQQFQVVTEKNRPAILCGRIHVVFIARRNTRKVPTEERNTPRGILRISTPEATALDLVSYPHHCAGLDNVATVLAELAEKIDMKKLANIAPKIVEPPFIQRLGYLLDKVGVKERTEPLSKVVEKLGTHATPLVSSKTMRSAPRNARWKVAVNSEIEVDG